MSDHRPASDLLVISHSGARSGAPMVLLRFLTWLSEETEVDAKVLLLHGGTMEQEFERFDARILGGAQSRLWMIQRGLTNLHFGKAAAALALARQGPPMWSHRSVPLVLLNSTGSLPVVRFMPAGSSSKVVLYVHELDDSFERTLGTSAWRLLSPRVDHFITCSEQVTDMLVNRRGVAPERITEHPGVRGPARGRAPPICLPPPPAGHLAPRPRGGRERSAGVAEGPRAVRPHGPIDGEPSPGPRPPLRVDGRTGRRLPGWKLIHDVQRAGLAGRLHLTGETEEPAQVMDMFDLFALTSREDPYPLTMLEAASLGIPIVSFDNGGATEFARSGRSGPLAHVVPYLDVEAMAEAALGLLDDPSARRALGQRAKQYVLENQLTSVAAPRLFDTLAAVEPRLAARGSRRRAGVAPQTVVSVIEPPAQVVVVDPDDREIGVADKAAVHEPPGVLHRALSAFVLDEEGRIVLQRRADSKYHFAGRWSNSCCTHPRPGESLEDAARRRTFEELGILGHFQDVGTFTYRAVDPRSGLVEHEVDHVMVAWCSDPLAPNPEEVGDVAAVHIQELERALASEPERYTPWLPSALAVLRASPFAESGLRPPTPSGTGVDP